ncbi:L-dopachrome tautomerase-related protein [Candidatus Neomarinimicrobiota bacterium]
MKSNIALFLSLIIFSVASCSSINPTESEKIIEDNNDTTNIETGLITVASSSRLWTGVAVSNEKRIFVNYPRWSTNHSISVAEISDSGIKVPYPNEEWNNWSDSDDPTNKFICVQSVYVDDNDYLWILDTGNPMLAGVLDSAAKIVKIDLNTDTIDNIIYLADNIPDVTSYLNDIRIDDNFAYITDSSVGTIVIINLDTGDIINRLSSHRSTSATYLEGFYVEEHLVNLVVHADGIAFDKDNGYLYYKALSSPYLYRIKSVYLQDFTLSDEEVKSNVEYLDAYGAADGMEIGPDGILYLTSLEENAIRRYYPESGESDILLESPKLKWPDSISITDDGYLYVTTSQLHLRPNERGIFKIYKISIQENN